jgi:hypothetical protein
VVPENGMGSYQSGAERFLLGIAIAIIITTVVAERVHKEVKEEAQFNTSLLNGRSPVQHISYAC